jgi:hypothetical protein
MASASTTSSNGATRKPSKKKPASKSPAQRQTEQRAAQPKPRTVFLPGSLNDQLSKLDVDETLARCQRIPLSAESITAINDAAQKYFKAQNSILSGGIAKVRGSADHKAKRFKMERGTYMSAGNDAMFAFLTVTRTE